MSAVFATPKDTQASRLGMLPSLLSTRPAGKVPAGAGQLEAGNVSLKKDQIGAKVQPEALKEVAPPEFPPPGLPMTPSAAAKEEALAKPGSAEDLAKGDLQQDPAGSDNDSFDGDSEEEDEAAAEKRRAAAETAEKTADGLPSVGSALHASGQCSRCCFFLKNRCRNGVNCQFCHLEHERRSRGRGCRGRGTSSKEAKAQAAAAAQAAQAAAQACVQPPTPQSVNKVPPSPAQQQWPKSMLPDGQEPLPTLLAPPPGLEPPSAPDAIKPVNMMGTIPTPTGAACKTPPPPSAPVLSNLPIVGPPPQAPPPFGAPRGIPEERDEAPPPPANSPGGNNFLANGRPIPAPLTTSAIDLAHVPPAPGLTPMSKAEEAHSSQITASQVLLATSAPPTPAPRLPAVEGCSFASLDGNVTWGQGLPAGNGSSTPAFRPTAGPVTVAQTPTASAAAAALATSVSGGAGMASGAILGTTPVPGGAMMPWIPGVPRHLCMQPGALRQPVVMQQRTPTAVRGAGPPACARPPMPLLPPASAPATPAAWRPPTDEIMDLSAAKGPMNQAEANSGDGLKPLKISLPELDCAAAPLDPSLPAKKRLPEWL